jgi:hypothetical protein
LRKIFDKNAPAANAAGAFFVRRKLLKRAGNPLAKKK